MPANAIPLGSQTRELNSKSIARMCEAIDRVRLSRAATRHAIERSRKSLLETQALLVALRHIHSDDSQSFGWLGASLGGQEAIQ